MNATTAADANGDLLPAVAAFIARSHGLFIGGEWTPASSGETMEIVDPATGQPIANVALGNAQDIDRAVRAAREAFDRQAWSGLPALQRQECLYRLAALIEDNLDELAMLESLDVGMPVGIARIFVGSVNYDNIRYLAGWVGKITGETYETATPNQHAYSIKEPVGVVGAITPWNAPLRSVVNKVVPALVAGCTVVVKPAEITPLTALRFGELVKEAGIPDGVVNIVTGLGSVAGQALVEHPLVDKITFTGSTATGKQIARTATGNLKRVTLELGGKSPAFVFPDADLERAIPNIALNIFGNSGQMCSANSRLYVHKDIYDRVVSGIAEFGKGLKVGAGRSPGVQLGPVVSQAQLDRVMGFVEAGRGDGAEVVAGGSRIEGPGYFVQPTVLADTSRSMSVVRDEIFGPVLCAMPMQDDDLDALARIGNDTQYGLAAYVWTRDIGIAHNLSRKLKAGWVRVNGGSAVEHNVPFGGYKQSGWGRERGREGVEAYMETKSIIIDL